MKKPNQKITLWAAALIAAVILVMAVIVAVTPSQPTQQAAGGPSVVSSTGGAGTGCNVRTGDTSSKPALPGDLRWEAAKGWTWPVSATYGPTQHRNGLGVCFARSPLGAALAMATIYGAGATQDQREVTQLYVSDSAGKTAALAKATSSPSGESSSSSAGPITFSGFITDSFTPDEAHITMVFATSKSSTGYVGLPSTLQWVDGDWKVQVLDDGTGFAGNPTTPAEGSFVSWGSHNG